MDVDTEEINPDDIVYFDDDELQKLIDGCGELTGGDVSQLGSLLPSSAPPPPPPPKKRKVEPRTRKNQTSAAAAVGQSAIATIAVSCQPWVPVAVNMRDPALGCRIKLAGVGAKCKHWQPFCLLFHWRRWYNIQGKPSDGYACPVAGCNQIVRFDSVVIMEELSINFCGADPMLREAEQVSLMRAPRMVLISMKPVAPNSARATIDPTVLGDSIERESNPDDAIGQAEDGDDERRKMLLDAIKHRSDFWRQHYCNKRDALKKLRRRSLRAGEQLDILTADNSELRAILRKRVIAIEAIQQRQTTRGKSGAPVLDHADSPALVRLYCDSRSMARHKLTQLQQAIVRERETKRPIGGKLASEDRVLLVALWRVFVEVMEKAFAAEKRLSVRSAVASKKNKRK
jgi:hypothetical protein